MKKLLLPLLGLALTLVLANCNSDDDTRPRAPRTYSVTLTNAMNNQPLAPMAVIVHTESYSAFELGEAASAALEVLAEGGDPADLVLAANTTEEHVSVAQAGTGIIGPGASETMEILVPATGTYYITVVSMLVNTNDAFIAVANAPASALASGASARHEATVYDAGTEANSETAATIPGPAGGGEGFNAARDDRDTIAVHPGVVTADDGLATSALDQSHRWDNPGAVVTITRE